MAEDDNVADFPGARPRRGSGSSGNGGDFGEHLARLETHMQHMATKTCVLGGVIGGMILAASLAIAILKLFADSSGAGP